MLARRGWEAPLQPGWLLTLAVASEGWGAGSREESPCSSAARAPHHITWWVGSACSQVQNSLLLPRVLQRCEDVTMATQVAGDLALALNLLAAARTPEGVLCSHLVPRRP